MKKFAFTLGEILLAIAVIGVVAALTIPSLIENYKSKVYTTQLKKTYSQLTNAIQQIMIDENANDEISEVASGNGETTGFYTTSAGLKTSNSTQGAQYFLTKYFKIKSSGGYGTAGVMADNYTTPNGAGIGTVNGNYYCVGLKDSSSICMRNVNGDPRVVIDVNGTEPPNISGQDLFVMHIENNGNVSDLTQSSTCNTNSGSISSGITLEQYASGCFAKVEENGWTVDLD